MTTPADLLRAALPKILDPTDWTQGDPQANDPCDPRTDAVTAMVTTREEFIDRDETREAEIWHTWHEAMRQLAAAANPARAPTAPPGRDRDGPHALERHLDPRRRRRRLQDRTGDMTMRQIPLGSLEPSDDNVRTIPAGDKALEELTASIAALGLLENLVVHEVRTGRKRGYRVVAGKRRWQALKLLQKRRTAGFNAKTPVDCQVIPADANATEISLAENAVREDMHPVDQVLAFRKLNDAGTTTEEIANRFGLTVRTVERRLRLAGVAEPILDAGRRNHLALDHLEAFASTSDQNRQLAIWQRIEHNDYAVAADWIKRQLRDGNMYMSEDLSSFVGLDAYEAAGGRIDRDLFTDENHPASVQVLDVDLMRQLAEDHLAAAAAELEDGWRWTEKVIDPEYNLLQRFGRIHGKPMPPTPEQEQKLADVQKELAEVNAKIEALPEPNENDWDPAGEPSDDPDSPEGLQERQEDLEASTTRLEDEIDQRRSFSLEERACSGCILSIADGGHLLIAKGLVRPEHRELVPPPPAPPAPDLPATPADPAAEAEPPAPATTPEPDPRTVPAGDAPSGGLPAGTVYTPPRSTSLGGKTENPETVAAREAGMRRAVADDLRLIRSTLVKAHLAAAFDAAFDLATYQMVMSSIAAYRYRGTATPLSLTIHDTPDLPMDAQHRDRFIPESPGIELLAANGSALDLDWSKKRDDRKRFDAFRNLPIATRRALFSAAVARSLNPQLAFDPTARPETEAVIESLDIPFNTSYRPGLDIFWSRQTRKELLAIAETTLGAEWADAHRNDRKPELAKALASAFAKDAGDNPGLSAAARKRALDWTPTGLRAFDTPNARTTASRPDQERPTKEPADSGPANPEFDATPRDDVPAWMNDDTTPAA